MLGERFEKLLTVAMGEVNLEQRRQRVVGTLRRRGKSLTMDAYRVVVRKPEVRLREESESEMYVR